MMKKLSLINLSLVQMSSPHHYALWNALSVETLAGDLQGFFGKDVSVSVYRILKEREIKKVAKKIIDQQLHILGISIEIGSLDLTKHFISYLENRNLFCSKFPLLILGNQLPTYEPEYFLEHYRKAIIVLGEGEEALRGIVKYVHGYTSLESVPSLMYIKGIQIHKTIRRSPELSQLIYPPSLDTVSDVVKHSGNALIEASRGCAWSKCAYCTIKSFRAGKKWEGFPISRVLKNIQELIDAGVTELEFADADFFGSRETYNILRIIEFSEGLSELLNSLNTSLTFRIFLEPRVIYKPDDGQKNSQIKYLLRQLKLIGLTKVFVGIESGCASQLLRYKRGNTIKQLKNVIRILRDELDLAIDFGFLMFDPELTLEELIKNITFFKKHDLIKGNQWPFRPITVVPETKIAEHLDRHDRLGNLNLNFLSHPYEFTDSRIDHIYSIIDSISRETKDIFYSLKVISKQQFDDNRKRRDTIIAQEYIEKNGLIYLRLMFELAKSLQECKPDLSSVHIASAQKEIKTLVNKCAEDIEKGVFADHFKFLAPKIDKYLSEK